MIEQHALSENQIRDLYGWAEINPSNPVVAGEIGTWRIVYHAGGYGVDDGGVIKVAWRDVSDWERPQFTDSSASGYATVATTGPASLRVVFERQRYIRPWRLCVTIDVYDDSLSEGDTVILTLGDTSSGSPGIHAQTFCKHAFEFRVSVDWCGTWVYTEVSSPTIPIVSGAPHRLAVVGPSLVAPGEETWVGLRVEDAWGNPCSGFSGEVDLNSAGLSGLPANHRFSPAQRGVYRFQGVVAPGPGVYRVTARERERGLEATGNPLKCVESPPVHTPYWGDLHGQSEETVGTNPAADYFRFARESALVDFIGHQGNDFQITEDVWAEIKKQANTHYDPGRFVTFVGYEWSGNTPLGGDHNVYYSDDDGPLHRSSHVLIPDKSDLHTGCMHIRDLYASLKNRDALLTPHVGGRYGNMAWHDPDLERLVEIYSEWGEFEWFLFDALDRGYRVGFVAGSDDHKGRPGAAHPGGGSFGVYGGLTCVYASELTREGVWEALRARRCYATTGQRILLDVRVAGHPMGSDCRLSEPPEISVQVHGTAPIERVDIFRGAELIYAYPEAQPRARDRVRVAWSGQRIRARNRRVVWDGSLSLDQGRITAAEGYAFDTPAEGIRSIADRCVTWRSVTTGDADGVVLSLDAPLDTRLQFSTQVLCHSVALRDIAEGPVEIDAGGVDMKLVLEQLPLGSGDSLSFTFQESRLDAGCHPYWVRVLQTDGAKAWSSPVFVAAAARSKT